MFDYIKNPMAIEEKSFEMISEALGDKNADGLKMDIVKRVIHTTADFEYAQLLQFKPQIEDKIVKLFQQGCTLISDTNMIQAGINKKLAEALGIELQCFVSSQEAFELAKQQQITRSMAAVDLAAEIPGKKIFVIGNAPTALYRIMEHVMSGKMEVEVVVGVPVGFVGAAESKEALWNTEIPSIITKGRKGGSTIGVAIVNAVMKEAKKQIEK